MTPWLNIAGLNGVALQFLRQAHAITAAFDTVWSLKATSKCVFTTVTCLGCPFFREIFAHQAVRIGDGSNIHSL
jgi:hypothetical protein